MLCSLRNLDSPMPTSFFFCTDPWPDTRRLISELGAFPYTLPDLSLCQGHTIWITVAVQYILKSGSVRPPVYRFQDCFEDWKDFLGIKIPWYSTKHPSTHVGQLTITCNSSPRGSDALIWTPWVCMYTPVHVHTHTYTERQRQTNRHRYTN